MEQATLNCLMSVEIADLPSPPPVYKGADRPLMRAPIHARNVHGDDGMSDCGLIHPQLKAVEGVHAADAIIRLVEEAGASKPSAAYFDYVFSRIDGITRENCLLVGDSLSSDIRGANNYGLPCCWYNPKEAARPEDLRIDYEIRDLRQLYDLV